MIEPIDDIPVTKQEVGFGAKQEKAIPFETPYKFRVLAIGKPFPYYGLWVECEAKPGDIISHLNKNSYFRENFNELAFMLDGKKVMIANFSDILCFWEKSNEKSTHRTDTIASTPIEDIFREYEGDRP